MKSNQLRGERFGRLIAVKITEVYQGRTYWLCQCDCGEKVIVPSSELTRGKTTACRRCK